MAGKTSTKRVTLSRIAEICGVSRQVVSHIVSGNSEGSSRYSEETRQRVLAEVERQGYRPNRTVKGFFRKRHGQVALLAHSPYYIPPQSMLAMMHEAHKQDLLLTLEYLGEGSQPKTVTEDCVDGFILFETLDPELMATIRRYGLPVVQVNTNERYGAGCITYDEEPAARLAAARFHGRGCRQPAIVGQWGDGAPTHYSHDARTTSFRAAAIALGMAAPVLLPSAANRECGADLERLLTALRENPQIDAVLCLQDIHVPGLYDALRTLGRRVPDDVAVIGWNNDPLAGAVWPKLTTFGVDGYHIGLRAVLTLSRLIAGKPVDDEQVIPVRLVERDSA